MRFLLIASCPNGFHRATRLCFRTFDAMKVFTSGASPICPEHDRNDPLSTAAENIPTWAGLRPSTVSASRNRPPQLPNEVREMNRPTRRLL
jgi:hypothetical protein